MKKTVCTSITGVLLLLGTSSSWAQPIKGAGEIIRISSKAERAISNAKKASGLATQLEKRVAQTYMKTGRSLERAAVDPIVDVRGLSVVKQVRRNTLPFSINPYELYPNAPDGLTRESLSNYIATKNNLEVRKFISQAESRSVELFRAMNDGRLEETLLKELPPVGKELDWLAAQLEPDTQYLLVGEQRQTRAEQAVRELLPKIREQMPGREIILFTDSLPESISIMENWLCVESIPGSFAKDDKSFPLMKAANAAGMYIVGMEPGYMLGNSAVDIGFVNSTGMVSSHSASLWETVEGIRLRNEAWLKTIREYRQKYPQALFIINDRYEQSSYDMPYSLGSVLAGEKTFVVEMGRGNGFDDSRRDFIPIMQTSEQMGSSRVVQFKDRDISRLVGFDAHIELE